jgi:hypothetical protein
MLLFTSYCIVFPFYCIMYVLCCLRCIVLYYCIVLFYLFFFCTRVGLLPPGANPIAVKIIIIYLHVLVLQSAPVMGRTLCSHSHHHKLGSVLSEVARKLDFDK